jgi:hypothetical protein
MNREQIVDKLYYRAMIYFNNSINFEYEDEYQKIGRAYVFLAEGFGRNQINASTLAKKIKKLEQYARTLKRE